MKKKLPIKRRNDAFNKELIQFAQVNPWMYYKKSNLDDNTKEKLWSAIDNELLKRGINIDNGSKCRWKSLRDKFVREHKLPKSDWKYYEDMLFLTSHVKHRIESSNINPSASTSRQVLNEGQDFSQEQMTCLSFEANEIKCQEGGMNCEPYDKNRYFQNSVDIDEHWNIEQSEKMSPIEVPKEAAFPKQASQIVVKEFALLDRFISSSDDETQHETSVNDSSTSSNFAPTGSQHENMGPARRSCKPTIVDYQVLPSTLPLSSQHSVTWPVEPPPPKPILNDLFPLSSQNPVTWPLAPSPSEANRNGSFPLSAQHPVAWPKAPPPEPIRIDSSLLSATFSKSAHAEPEREIVGPKVSSSEPNISNSQILPSTFPLSSQHPVTWPIRPPSKRTIRGLPSSILANSSRNQLEYENIESTASTLTKNDNSSNIKSSTIFKKERTTYLLPLKLMKMT